MKIFAGLLMILCVQLSKAEVGVVADVSLTPAGDFKATMNEISGSVTVKGDTITANDVRVKLANLKTGMSLRDKHTKDKYLEVKKFPEAILTIGSGKSGKGTGKLKIKNIEKDISGTYKIVGNNVLAEFPIKLSDYGIKGIKYMGVGVDDNVMVHVEMPIKK